MMKCHSSTYRFEDHERDAQLSSHKYLYNPTDLAAVACREQNILDFEWFGKWESSEAMSLRAYERTFDWKNGISQ